MAKKLRIRVAEEVGTETEKTPSSPKKRTRRTKKAEETAPAAAPGAIQDESDRLKPAYWPEVTTKEPREVVFDYLHEDDLAFLKERNYSPVLLRTLPVTTPEDVLRYNRYLMRGVLDGTVSFSKPRADALLLDMRHRNLLDRKGAAPLRRKLDENADLRDVLDWDISRYAAGNTTIVDAEDIRTFVEKVLQSSREEN